jgi:hypothetical protein
MPQRNRNRTLVISALALLVAWPLVVAAFNPQPEPPGASAWLASLLGRRRD